MFRSARGFTGIALDNNDLARFFIARNHHDRVMISYFLIFHRFATVSQDTFAKANGRIG